MSGFWKRAGLTVGAWILGASCLALWAGRPRAEASDFARSPLAVIAVAADAAPAAGRVGPAGTVR